MTDDDVITRGQAVSARLAAQGFGYGQHSPNGETDWNNYEDVPPPDEPPDVDDHHTGEWPPNADRPTDNGRDRLDEDDGLDDETPADLFETLVAHEHKKLRIRLEAQRRLDDEDHPPARLPVTKGLSALLAEARHPHPLPHRWRGSRRWPDHLVGAIQGGQDNCRRQPAARRWPTATRSSANSP